ncbi:MAG: hypothetical protein Q7R73_01050 [bacterium]|nr:hypothetical protein [bacterium]
MKKMLCAGFAALALLFPWGVLAAEPLDPAQDLKHDIEILQFMILADLSKYPLPTITIVPEAEFDAALQKGVDEGRVPERKLGVSQSCETNPDSILISSSYERIARELETPLDPYKYFRLVRAHGLYHWAMCKMGGPDRFWRYETWVREEQYAFVIEQRFFQEQLGMIAALPEDYQFPPRVNEMTEGTLPDESLRHQPWKLVNDDQSLTQWPTTSGFVFFVAIAQSVMSVERLNQFPNYDVPGQHIPRVPNTYVMYYYQAIMHRGKYVGFEKFELGGDNAKMAFGQGLWERKEAWWDKGYIPVMKDGKGFAPNTPVYTGEWVHIVEPGDTK